MVQFLSFLMIFTVSINSFAASLYDVKINGTPLYDVFVKQGVPNKALERAFEFLDMNSGKKFMVRSKKREKNRSYMRDRSISIRNQTITIIDYSKPSSERRLYILNLKTGTVSKHYVAHGKESGVNHAIKFSNINGSKMSSLGFFIAGDTYIGAHGESLNLYGLEPSNNNAAERDIVIHAANYVSEDFIKENGRLGRSWGCPAVAPGIIDKVIKTLEEGGVLYAYHKDLIVEAAKNPIQQETKTAIPEKDIDLPEEEGGVRQVEIKTKNKGTNKKPQSDYDERDPALQEEEETIQKIKDFFKL